MSKIKRPIFWKTVSQGEKPASTDHRAKACAAKHNALDTLIILFLRAIGIKVVISPSRIVSSSLPTAKLNLNDLGNFEVKEDIDISLIYRLKNFYFYLDLIKPELVEFFKFGIVGISGIFVDLAVVTFFKEVFKFDVRLCSVLSFPFAVTSNYLLNNYWTFKGSGKANFLDYAKFFFANLIGLAVRIWSIHLLLMVVPNLGQKYYLAVTMFGILIAFFINFLTSKFLIFKKSSTRPKA